MIKNYKPELNAAYVEMFYDFKGIWDVPSRCGLKVTRKKNADIVIATELYLENPGSSVTEVCSKLAGSIVREYNLDPLKMIFIVRAPENNSKLSFLNEFFSRAIMQWDGMGFGKPKWMPLTGAEVQELLNAEEDV